VREYSAADFEDLLQASRPDGLDEVLVRGEISSSPSQDHYRDIWKAPFDVRNKLPIVKPTNALSGEEHFAF
jgi:hypothetical protein